MAAGKGGQLRRGSMLHCKAIAPKYGVTPKTIRDVWSGRSWAKTTRHLWTDEEMRRRGAGEPEGDEHDGMGAHGSLHRLSGHGVQPGYAGGDFNGLNASLMGNPFGAGGGGNMSGNFSNASQLGTPQQWFQGNGGGAGFVGAGMQPHYHLQNAMGGNFGGYNQMPGGGQHGMLNAGMLGDVTAAHQSANGMGNNMGAMLGNSMGGMLNQQLGNFSSMSANNNALNALGANGVNIGSQGVTSMGMGQINGGQV
jgi:hypothetical protein